MKCEVCGFGPEDGVSLFRQNAYGIKGIWRCREHNKKLIDETVNHIAKIIEEDNKEKNLKYGWHRILRNK